MSTRLSTRLARLLNMVPYFIANPGISAAQAAAELGVSTDQVMNDLNQLFVCGLPGYGPGDLIDLSFSEESIVVTFSAGIDRPLRLTSTEATALLVALRSLVEMPGIVDPTAAQGAIAKIESAAGTAAAKSGPTGVRGKAAIAGTVAHRAENPVVENPPTENAVTEDPVAATVRGALYGGRALRLTYYSASRDAVSERVVDPMRIVLVDDHSYLQAWCRAAEGVRLFRFDRIDTAVELAESASPPVRTLADEDHLELFSDDPTLPSAHLEIAPEYAWVLDYYPMNEIGVRPDGSIEATMRFGALEWMARLALGFGSGVSVLGPPELVEEVRARAAAALSAYDLIADAESPGPAR